VLSGTRLLSVILEQWTIQKEDFLYPYFHAIEIAHWIPDSTLQVEVYDNKYSS
jgi:hypothetical protein